LTGKITGRPGSYQIEVLGAKKGMFKDDLLETRERSYYRTEIENYVAHASRKIDFICCVVMACDKRTP